MEDQTDTIDVLAAVESLLAKNLLRRVDGVDGDPLTSSLISGPANASDFQLNSNGTFSHTPKAGFIGEDSFTYSATDPQVGAEPGQAMVTITVSGFGRTSTFRVPTRAVIGSPSSRSVIAGGGY